MDILSEIKKRRTFAIISHPDAGKTTLTEKLLLFGGAIQTAGAVKSNKIKKGATSDFMEIERQRGISVATSVMNFFYKGVQVNILDTPGHKDFAEDTYRTLTAVDSVILVIDCVKGVEEQTENLMKVCRLRKTPVIVFINKMDREGKYPFDLLDEIEQKLSLPVRPLSWPISMGKTFQGVYNIYSHKLNLFESSKTEIADHLVSLEGLDDPRLESAVGEHAKALKEDVELIEGIYEPFSVEAYRNGDLAPVFFGSALNNFGVNELLDTFIQIAPNPLPRQTNKSTVLPSDPKLTGFVFKIHANLDPNHRDRIAFFRICSGVFERNKFYYHPRLDKKMKFSAPVSFMANERKVVEEAYPGDVVGLYDTGNFKIGDSLSEGENIYFQGIPIFSPEIFREVENKDPLKTKQLEKGIRQLTDEGVAQLFIQPFGNRKIIGTVGDLQFEVIKFRLLNEYGASCNFRHMNYYKAAWVTSKSKEKINEFFKHKQSNLAFDKNDNPVYLAESEWYLNRVIEQNPDLKFSFSSEVFSEFHEGE
ncbi:MAG TPA: peptide chain release factor 3 [Cytophagales bacterium]|nr:peptide chain release factor 3 [Cytophagales bacterium]